MKIIFFKILFLLFVASSSHAVTNQELMDRLDDMEFDRQQREMDRLMDRQLQEYIKQSNQRPYVPPKTQSKNYPAAKASEMCYIFWDGLKFQIGKTESDRYDRFIRQFYGVDRLEFAIPKDTTKMIYSNKKRTDTDLSAIEKFLVLHWSRISSICGF